ncbi:MAG: S49 family peptidase [Burkholderia sp.]
MSNQPSSPDSTGAERASNPPATPQADREPNWERAALERIAMAAIVEQRTARRWRIAFRFLWLSMFLVLVFVLFDFSGDGKLSSSRHTALVTIDGEIAAGTNANAEDINSALDDAFEDSGTVGVVLRINSPGGSPVQAGIVYDEIRRLLRQYPSKPLYVVVSDMCASGGYYIASAADKIYVNQASIVGSIGVLMDGFGFTGLMDKLGVQRRLHTSGENKSFFDPFSPETLKMDEHAQAMLDEIHAQFIQVVKDGRGKRLHELPEIFSGLFWTGAKSVELGLADGFGTAETVARDVLKAPDIVDYTVKESLSNRVARRFGAAIGGGAVKSALSESGLKLH